MSRLRTRISLFGLALAFWSLAGASLADETAPVPEIRPGFLKGYLSKEALPDSAILLPPPPAVGSVAEALDLDIARASLALRDTPRWQLAVMDANLSFPDAAGNFSCALGARVTEQTPRGSIRCSRRVTTDAGLATFAAKDKYQRARPFMLDGQPICTPDKGEGSQRARLVPFRPYVDRLGLGARPCRGVPGSERGDPRARPRLRREPRRLQRPLGERRDRRPFHRRGDGCAPSRRTGVRRRSRGGEGRTCGGARKKLPPHRDCKFEAEALAQTPPLAP